MSEATTLPIGGQVTRASPLRARVARFRAEAQDVVSLELTDPQGGPLPAFEPGAHIDLHLPNGLVKQYSLCNPAGATDRYRIAVGRSATSRGGSAFVHDHLRVGTILTISVPKNNFPLAVDASRHLFIAGGIGITTILSMLAWCAANRKPWRLLYCAQSRQRAAFVDDILALQGGEARFHFDNEQGGRLPDIEATLALRHEGEHVYCCGPSGLMRSVDDHAATDWPVGAVHFEWFTAATPPSELTEEEPFDVILQQGGQRFTVPAGRSILETLEENGVLVPFGCREGLCGTCETQLCGGEPEHRDSVLSKADRAANRSLMICVSRAKSGPLVLDL